MPTKRVTVDVNKSNYKRTICGLTYYFSSPNNLKRFDKGLEKNREYMKSVFEQRWNIKVNIDSYFDLVHYVKIERRGFKVVDLNTKEVLKCLPLAVLDGEIRMLGNLENL